MLRLEERRRQLSSSDEEYPADVDWSVADPRVRGTPGWNPRAYPHRLGFDWEGEAVFAPVPPLASDSSDMEGELVYDPPPPSEDEEEKLKYRERQELEEERWEEAAKARAREGKSPLKSVYSPISSAYQPVFDAVLDTPPRPLRASTPVSSSGSEESDEESDEESSEESDEEGSSAEPQEEPAKTQATPKPDDTAKAPDTSDSSDTSVDEPVDSQATTDPTRSPDGLLIPLDSDDEEVRRPRIPEIPIATERLIGPLDVGPGAHLPRPVVHFNDYPRRCWDPYTLECPRRRF